jgi:hypothetical protein
LRPEALLDGERIDYGDRRSRRARRDRMAIAFQQYIQGRLVDEGPPAQIFGGARTEQARASVGRLLRH